MHEQTGNGNLIFLEDISRGFELDNWYTGFFPPLEEKHSFTALRCADLDGVDEGGERLEAEGRDHHGARGVGARGRAGWTRNREDEERRVGQGAPTLGSWYTYKSNTRTYLYPPLSHATQHKEPRKAADGLGGGRWLVVPEKKPTARPRHRSGVLHEEQPLSFVHS